MLLPHQSKYGRDKEHFLLGVFQIFRRRLEKRLGLNFSLRPSSLWARDSTRIELKESGITLALWGLLGWGTAPGIQLKESGIPLALWGALGVGGSTRDSTKGIRNPSSSLGGLWGWGTAPGIQLKESGIPPALRGALRVGGQEKSPPEFFLAS